MPDALDLSSRDTVMPIASMFHDTAWGLPYSAALEGAKLVLPGLKLDPESLQHLIYEEGVTMSAAVPTIWLVFADELPHTATGKLLKTKLRDEYQQHLASST